MVAVGFFLMYSMVDEEEVEALEEEEDVARVFL